MSEKASQFRIGIFVILGVAIVLAGLFLFGIRSAFQPTYMFETYTTGDVEGLSVGSVVKLRGVAVGKVTEIGFSWNMYERRPARVRRRPRAQVKQKIAPEQLRRRLRGRGSRRSSTAACAPSCRCEGITGIEHRGAADDGPEAVPAARGSLEAEVRVHPVGARASSAACSRRSTGRSRTSRSSTSGSSSSNLEPRPRDGRRRAQEPEPARREGHLARTRTGRSATPTPRSRRSRRSPRTPARTCRA